MSLGHRARMLFVRKEVVRQKVRLKLFATLEQIPLGFEGHTFEIAAM
jgi:hypothetical protein